MNGTFDSVVCGASPWMLKKLNELRTSDSLVAGLGLLVSVGIELDSVDGMPVSPVGTGD